MGYNALGFILFVLLLLAVVVIVGAQVSLTVTDFVKQKNILLTLSKMNMNICAD